MTFCKSKNNKNNNFTKNEKDQEDNLSSTKIPNKIINNNSDSKNP